MGRTEEVERPSRPLVTSTVRIALMVLASFALVVFALCEAGTGFPVAWWIYVALAILFALVLVRRTRIRRQIVSLSTLGALCALMAALHFVDWTTRKPFLRDLDRIQPGMTEAEVRRIMAPYSEGTGWPAIYGAPSNTPGVLHVAGTGASYATGRSASGELLINDSLVFRHDTNGDLSSDWGIVTFSTGRVVKVGFSPD